MHADDARELSRRQFGAHAERYVSSRDHQTSESLDRLVVLAAPRPEWHVLDIATGGGHTALALAPLVHDVVASDLTPAMLQAAERFIREHGATNVSFREADACALPFEDATFDLVTCRVAPHHFPDIALFVRECARVSKPGGTVIVIDNVVPEDKSTAAYINAVEKLRDPSHQRACPESEWLGFFRAAGLRVERVEHYRKKRDFDFWAGMQSVDAATKATLRGMFLDAPPLAREALGPHEHDGKLDFYLDELLVLARNQLT